MFEKKFNISSMQTIAKLLYDTRSNEHKNERKINFNAYKKKFMI